MLLALYLHAACLFARTILFIVIVIAFSANTVNADDGPNCVAEYGTCVMNRDCCGDLQCITGDWSVTTDSTCLSERSQQLNALQHEKQIDLIQLYYADTLSGDRFKLKSPDEAAALAKKYIGSSFAQLVSRLERKYGVGVEMSDGTGSGSVTSDATPESEL